MLAVYLLLDQTVLEKIIRTTRGCTDRKNGDNTCLSSSHDIWMPKPVSV